jgi:hypothetical protein
MDRPFESDVMEDLAAEAPVTSADEFDAYESLEQESFEDQNAFGDGMEDFAEGTASFEDGFGDGFEDGFADNLEGDFWDGSADSAESDYAADYAQEHRSNQRESNRARHEQGNRRRGMDRGGEAGDNRRQVPRRRPPGHRGLWPPRTSSFDEADELNEFADGFEDGFEDGFGDEAEAPVNAMDAMDAAIADAMAAEDSDEFLRRAVQGIRRAAQVARSAGRVVGQVARTVAPIASAIPLPQAQAIARVANVAGRLLADGADEFEALDELLAFAEAEDAIDAAAPMIAGLTIRTTMPRAARLNPTTRRQLVSSVRQSTQALARRQGPQAARAVPRVVQAVQRTAQRRRVPPQQLPQAVRRATATVVRNPRLVSQLARATQQASAVVQRYSTRGGGRTAQHLVIRGPVEITIRSR